MEALLFLIILRVFLLGGGGQIVFKGKATIADGLNIFVNHGTLSFGDDFYANKNLIIQCEKQITVGNQVLFGWNVSLRDTDGHIVECNGVKKRESAEIIVDSDAWLASDVTALKNTYIGKGCIVACNTLLTGFNIREDHCLIAGIPGRIKKRNIKRIS